MHTTRQDNPRPRAARAARLAALTLLSVALAACGGDTATGPGGGGGNTPRSETPGEIVGTWVYGVISPTDFYDAYNGQWLDNAYGTSVMFTFTADGRYTQDILIYTTVYQCRTQVFVHNEGTMVTEGDQFRVYPTKGRVISSDTCNAAFNFDRPDDIGRKQGDLYTWRFDEGEFDGKTYLMIGVGGYDNPSSFRPAD